MNNDKLLQIRKNCKYFLHGHYSKTPAEYFKEMSEETSITETSDHYGSGDSIKKFEEEMSNLFGFEDCVFLQSGTMAQLIAMRIWTDKKDKSLIGFHPTCHLEIHEQMAYKELHQLESILIGDKKKLINLDDLTKKL